MPAVGEIIELKLSNPAHQGACVARDADGRVVFVLGGLPGETVRARVLSVQSSLAWAHVVEVNVASPDRQEHVWPEGQATGAADLGHVKVAAQRQWKTRVLHDQLQRIGGVKLAEQVQAVCESSGTGVAGVVVQPAPGDEELADPVLGRRTRISLTADARGRLGMRKYRSRQVIPLETMPLGDPSLRFDVLGAAGLARWRGAWQPGAKVELIAPSAGRPVVAVEKMISVKPKRGARGWKRYPTRQVIEVFADPGRRTQTDKLTWSVEVGGRARKFQVSAGGFWQAHRSAPALLAARVVELADLQEGDCGLELYAGAGLLTAFMLDRLGAAGSLSTLEASGQAVKDAGRNLAAEVDEGRLQLFEGGANRASVMELAGTLPSRPEFVVLDPPRSGAGRQVLEAVEATGANTVVLASCDPAAAARDLGCLTQRGYRLAALEAWDLFPHTHHFETIALLHRVC